LGDWVIGWLGDWIKTLQCGSCVFELEVWGLDVYV
jgi:hypothetical protein